jgi:hypothetical protein
MVAPREGVERRTARLADALFTGVRGRGILRSSLPLSTYVTYLSVGMAGDNHPERKLRMSDSDELASKERRRRLIERLNDTEKLIGLHSPTRGVMMSEEELAAEIEKQRTLNLMRASFPSSL